MICGGKYETRTLRVPSIKRALFGERRGFLDAQKKVFI